MSFQERNIAVSLGSFIFILGFYLFRMNSLMQAGDLNSTDVFRLWGIIIVMAIVLTIAATILAHILATILEVIRTGEEEPEIEDIEDERDKLIDLRGTKVTYIASSIGVLLAMLTFVFGQPPLVMFSLLIFTSLVAQIVGDVSRLVLYRRGF